MKTTMKPNRTALVSLASLGLLTTTALANDPTDITAQEQDAAEMAESQDTWTGIREWIGSGEAYLKLRTRFESVDQDGFTDDAHALTNRTLLGYKLGNYGKFSGAVEFEDVRAIGNGGYNSTDNGVINRPVVADPEGGEVTQAYMTYAFSDRMTGTFGRQRMILDNARFVGNVGWRQNEQTFDAAAIVGEPVDGLNLVYAYVQNANRIFEESSSAGNIGSESHILNLSHDFEDIGKLTAYAYMLDLAAAAASTDTVGVRFTGKHNVNDDTDLLYNLELAQQDDAGDNPNTVDAGYMLAEVGLSMDAVTVKVGMETLEGSVADGAFSTPLATLHKFNGWADQFLATPTTGLEDTYVAISGKFSGVSLIGVYHDFSSESGSGDWGSELDFQATYPLKEGMLVGAKYADFSADDAAYVDTAKMWLWVAMSF
ncbi:MAG: alginate export family protein [Planctomycetota bacterium]|nr:alginate export family protein [Planctomycetota bacterium]